MKTSAHSGLLDQHARPLRRADASSSSTISPNPDFGRSNTGANTDGTFFTNWRSSLRSADADWFADRDRIVARARDVSRNDVVGASAGSRKVNRVVGAGWRLACRINARALGLSPDAAAELRSDIDTTFRHFAYGPSFCADAERTKHLGQLLRMAASHIFHDGEAPGVIEYASDEPTIFKTRLRLVDPDRLSNPNGQPDSPLLRNGVAKDAIGRITGYWFREAHPADVGHNPNSARWRFFARFATPLGRPQVLHAFDAKRAGQSRGISAFVSVLKSLRGLNKFTDATLEATTLNALFVAFAKSSAGPGAVSENLSAEDIQSFDADRVDYYKTNPINLGGAQIPVLPFGDEISMQTTERETGGFDSFVRAILRLIAAALGITYEELSMDFSQTNYSSARAALAIAYDEMRVFFDILATQIATPFYVAWLEEAIDIGEIVLPPGAPDFYDAIDAYAECRWIGPGRAAIDPTKEVDAAAARIEAGLSTFEDEMADDGKDWRDAFTQQAVEDDEREALGLLPIHRAPKAAKTRSGNLDAAAVDAANQQQVDQRPPGAYRPSARDRIHRLARSPEHNAALDARV